MLLELLDELVVGVDVGAGLLLFWGWQVGRAGQGFYQFAGQAHFGCILFIKIMSQPIPMLEE